MFPFPNVTIFCAPFSESRKDSHTLLLRAALQYSGLSSFDLGSLGYHSFGKPHFPQQPQIRFSITHSGDWWLCGFSNHDLGLDLQIHRSHCALQDLSERFFHPLEHHFLYQRSFRPFYDLWSAKESWVKYIGRGFLDEPASFSVVSSDGSFPTMPNAQFHFIPFESNYSLCLCTEKDVKYMLQTL